MRQDRENLYIYCLDHTLKLQGKTAGECPNAVLKFSKYTNFSIDGVEFEIHRNVYNTKDRFGYSVSDLINNRSFLLDNSHRGELGNLTTIITTQERLDKDIHHDKIEKENWLWKIAVIVLITVLITMSVCWSLCKTGACTRGRKELYNSRFVVHFQKAPRPADTAGTADTTGTEEFRRAFLF